MRSLSRLFIAVSLLPLSTNAQLHVPITRLGAGYNKAQGFTPRHDKHGQTNVANKATATSSRLISAAYITYDAINNTYDLRDSFTYSYSGNRGGYQNSPFEWTWQYDTSRYYHFEEGYVFWEPIRSIQLFDPKNNLARYEYQRYDTSTNIGTTTYEEMYVYDSLNNKVLTKIREWDPHGVWSSSRITNAYDSYNNLNTQTITYWNPAALVWQNIYRYSFTYDWNHNMLTDLEEQWDTTSLAWAPVTGIIFTYDSNNNALTQSYQNWDGVTWQNTGKILFSNFTMHQPGAAVYMSWNVTSFDTASRSLYTYNSYGQPTIEKAQQSWFDHNWFGYSEYIIRYHYETYTNSIQNIKNQIADISIYPVPAGDEITINITWKQPQAFSITLMDLKGRIYTQFTVQACTQYEAKMATTNLTPGDYIINIGCATGNTTKRINVIK